MCGIFGFSRREPDASWRTRAQAMARALRHRGPDGAAVDHRPPLTLGVTRLGIVAPEEPARVHASRSGETRAVFNGEIYNHAELRRELDDLGRAPADLSDAALVPELFELYGPSFAGRLRGIFAMAIGSGERLWLLRDAVGVKPLYWTRGALGLVFGSEQKALLADPALALSPDLGVAARFVVRGQLEEELPLYIGVHAVPPGQILTWDGAEVRLAPQPDAAAPAGPADFETELEAELEASLEAAVTEQARAEVPAALLLSGGVDSTLIAALARPHVRRSYTLAVPGWNESPKARRAASALGLELRVVEVGTPTLQALSRVLWHLEYPDARLAFGVGAVLRELARALAADGVRVVLSGEGADELFLGYPWHRFQAAEEHGWPAPEQRGHDAAGFRRAALAAGREGADAHHVWQRAADGPRWQHRLERVEQLLGAAPAGLVPATEATGCRGRQLRSLRRDLQTGPLRCADRLMMSEGIEARVPYLDARVVGAALRLPPAALETQVEDKPALRRIARRRLPGLDLPPKQGLAARHAPDAATLAAWGNDLAGAATLVSAAELRRLAAAAPADARERALLWHVVMLELTHQALTAGARACR